MIPYRDLILVGYLVEFAACGLLAAVFWSAWCRFRTPPLRYWAAAFACMMAFLLARSSAHWSSLPSALLALRGSFTVAAACAHATLLVLGARALVTGSDVPRRRAFVVLALAAGVPAALSGGLGYVWPDALPAGRSILLALVNSVALALILRLPPAGSRAGVGARIALVGLVANVTCQVAYLAAFLPLEPGSWLASRAWLLGFGDALWQPLVGFGLSLWYLEHEHEAALESAAEARRNAEALVESRKLHTIQLLSGGVLHDCINAMTIVLGCGEALSHRLAGDAESRGLLDAIRGAARRAAEVARRGFATGQAEPTEELSIRDNVEEATHWLRHLLGPGVQLQLELDADAPAVLCRRSDLQQILANLAVNARDALGGSGHVWIRLKRAPGQRLLWEFEDDGPGIDPAIRERLFEPFVSTKKKDHGSGIGLASVRACVSLLGGTIRAVERAGGGTRFELSIPAARPASRVQA